MAARTRQMLTSKYATSSAKDYESAKAGKRGKSRKSNGQKAHWGMTSGRGRQGRRKGYG